MRINGTIARVEIENGFPPPPLKRMKPCRRGHKRDPRTVIWAFNGTQWHAQCPECRKITWKRGYKRRSKLPHFKEYIREKSKRVSLKFKKLRRINRWRLKMKPPKTMFEDIKDFHVKFGLAYSGGPRHLPEELLLFRGGFMAEELAEYANKSKVDRDMFIAMFRKMLINRNGTMEDKLDALVDLVYVALGTAYMHGFDFDEAWRRVHKANMKKVRSERKGNGDMRGGEFDVVKPEGWEPPDLSDLVR